MTREARRLQYLGHFAHLLHIPPTQVALLTIEEFELLCGYVDGLIKAMKK